MDVTWTGMSALLQAGGGEGRRGGNTELVEQVDGASNHLTSLLEEDEEGEGLITSEPLSYGSNKRTY